MCHLNLGRHSLASLGIYEIRRWNGVGPAWELMDLFTLVRDDDDGDEADLGLSEALLLFSAICLALRLAAWCARSNMVELSGRSCQSKCRPA